MLNYHRALFRPYRSQEAAQAAIGTIITRGDQPYRVTGHNDLGCLYGVKVNGKREGKREYVLD